MNSIIATHPRHAKAPTSVAVTVTIILFVLSLALSAFTTYTHNDKDLSNRVSVVETQQKNDGLRQDSTDKRLQRIEDKVDRLLERVK